MPRRHNTTSQLVEGVRLRHVLLDQGKRIPWCDHCTRAMFQFLATEQLCPRNCGKDITALARTMDCTHPGFEEAVWPKIKASLRRKLQDLNREGNIVIYTDHDGVEQAHWPVQTSRWRRSDWDGRRDYVVPEHIRERLETTGNLGDTGSRDQQQGGAYYVFERGRGGRSTPDDTVGARQVFERGRGGRGGRRPDTPEAPPPPSIEMEDARRRRPSVLSDDGTQMPDDLSDDGTHMPDGLSDDGPPWRQNTYRPPRRQNTYRPPYAQTASETSSSSSSSSSRRSRVSSSRSSRSRRYAPWNTSAGVNRSYRRRNDSRR